MSTETHSNILGLLPEYLCLLMIKWFPPSSSITFPSLLSPDLPSSPGYFITCGLVSNRQVKIDVWGYGGEAPGAATFGDTGNKSHVRSASDEASALPLVRGCDDHCAESMPVVAEHKHATTAWILCLLLVGIILIGRLR